MTGMSALWLPILLSAVFAFVMSSIIHMALGYHKQDYKMLPRQDDVMAALRPFGIPPGDYMVPKPTSMEEMKSEAFKEKHRQGPVVIMTVLPPWSGSMAKPLILWFLYNLVVSVFAAYVTGRAVAHPAPYLEVFRFAGVTAFVGYSLALAQASIWMGRSWRTTIVSMIDGLILGLITAGTFGWLWPKM